MHWPGFPSSRPRGNYAQEAEDQETGNRPQDHQSPARAGKGRHFLFFRFGLPGVDAEGYAADIRLFTAIANLQRRRAQPLPRFVL